MDDKQPRFGLASMISKWRSVISRQPGDSEDPEAPAPAESSWDEAWGPDPLLIGYETRTYHMPQRPHLPEEPPGSLVATLVRQHEPRQRRAVLLVHGWNEYFFQRHTAEFFDALGYDFYAIDLHRYGRSLQDGELFGYMEAIDDYYEELDACVALIKQEHSNVVLYGHSAGGLTASLYAHDRPDTFVGVILNSPWIDLQGSALFRALTPPLSRGLAVASPTMVLPPSENDLYGRSLHQLYEGEWEYDLGLKRIDSRPIRTAWFKAIVNGHDRVGAGLHIDCPVLLATSAKSSNPKEWNDDVMSTDLALDADRLAARAHLLGWHVTSVRLQGALHDVALSRREVRDRFFDEIRRWDLAYIRGPRTQQMAAQELGDGTDEAD